MNNNAENILKTIEENIDKDEIIVLSFMNVCIGSIQGLKTTKYATKEDIMKQFEVKAQKEIKGAYTLWYKGKNGTMAWLLDNCNVLAGA